MGVIRCTFWGILSSKDGENSNLSILDLDRLLDNVKLPPSIGISMNFTTTSDMNAQNEATKGKKF